MRACPSIPTRFCWTIRTLLRATGRASHTHTKVGKQRALALEPAGGEGVDVARGPPIKLHSFSRGASEHTLVFCDR